MKPKTPSKSSRFGNPTALDAEAPFFGATVQEWDKAFTGNMDKTLAEIKLRASSGPKRNASKAVTSDLASAVGKRLANAK